jgi:hypothetical protein
MSHFSRSDVVAAVLCLALHGLAFHAVRDLGLRSLLWLWIAYECALLFSHLPFPFSRTLYRSARWLYGHMNVTLFWGMEVLSAVFAVLVADAPRWVLLNAVTHGLFLRFAYGHGAQRSATHYSDPKKTLKANAIITFDNLCHITCLWCYLRCALGDATLATTVWGSLLATVAGLSYRFHRGEMRLAHFLHYLRRGRRW